MCTLRVRQLGGCMIARLAGEIDASNAVALGGHLSVLVEHGHIVIDLSDVDFLDSMALGALITVHKRAVERGTSIRLAGASGITLRVLKITRLDVHLDHYEHVADAVEAALGARDGVSDDPGTGRPVEGTAG
ncbi:MAG: STAS domain-containing protein [Jiangellaceae bacterium]